MFNLLDKKTKIIIGTIGALGIGAIIAKGLYDYSMYNILKGIERKFKKNSWEYYE